MQEVDPQIWRAWESLQKVFKRMVTYFYQPENAEKTNNVFLVRVGVFAIFLC